MRIDSSVFYGCTPSRTTNQKWTTRLKKRVRNAALKCIVPIGLLAMASYDVAHRRMRQLTSPAAKIDAALLHTSNTVTQTIAPSDTPLSNAPQSNSLPEQTRSDLSRNLKKPTSFVINKEGKQTLWTPQNQSDRYPQAKAMLRSHLQDTAFNNIDIDELLGYAHQGINQTVTTPFLINALEMGMPIATTIVDDALSYTWHIHPDSITLSVRGQFDIRSPEASPERIGEMTTRVALQFEKRGEALFCKEAPSKATLRALPHMDPNVRAAFEKLSQITETH